MKIPVEINLVSNEFILKVEGSRHPLMLYIQAGVPIVISTDDAGILRSNMTEQFVLLAQRYKDIGYDEIKDFIRNSIKYSFIKEDNVRKQLLKDFEKKLKKFESDITK